MSEFDYKQELVLEDDRALLRPIQLDDFDRLVHFSISEPEIWRYSLSTINSPETLRAYVEAAVAGREAGACYPFAVYDKLLGRWAGSTRFYEIDPRNGSVVVGYTWYGKAFQGTGLNKHCKFLLLRHAFEVWGMHRVEQRADVKNLRSIAAMKSTGCTVEGVLRDHLPLPDGTRRSSIILSILRSEWLDGARERLFEKLV